MFSEDLFSIAVACALGSGIGHPPGLWIMSPLGVLAADRLPGPLRRRRVALNSPGDTLSLWSPKRMASINPFAEL